jgi:hypothetical protein
MEREHAVQMLAALQSLSPGFAEATRITELIDNADEGRQLRRYLAASFGEPLFEIVRHIVRQYPDLDPDQGFGLGKGSQEK